MKVHKAHFKIAKTICGKWYKDVIDKKLFLDNVRFGSWRGVTCKSCLNQKQFSTSNQTKKNEVSKNGKR